MKNILHIIIISLFSLTIFSCAKEEEKKTEAPVLTEVYPVTTPTDDPSPDYTFSSTKAGTITYGGSCSSETTSATSGNNTITFLTLSAGTYSDCTIIVTDSDGNASNTLEVTNFLVDATAPTVSSIYPTDNQSDIPLTTDNISVTFSEAMDTTSVTTNTSNTTCSGSLQLSSDNFSSCFQMSSSPSNSNSDKTFTVDPSDNLLYSTSYKIRVTTGVKDASGNTMSSQYETSNGFTNTGLFVIAGNSSNDLSNYLTSTDNGTTWTLRTLSYDKQFLGLGYGNGTFVMGGREESITLTSSDGLSWTERTSGLTDTLNGVAYGNNTFVLVSSEGQIFTSSDAVSWDNRTNSSVAWKDYFLSKQFLEVTFGNNTFVAVGQYGVIVTSSDNGTSWDNRTSGSTTAMLEDVAFGNNTFIATGGAGIIFSSNDNGTSWDNVTLDTNLTFRGVAYGNDTFVLVGSSGTILSSSDNGTTWDNRTNSSVTSKNFYHVGYGNNVFVAVGIDGTIVTSSDNGTTWTSRTSGFSNSLYNVTYSQ